MSLFFILHGWILSGLTIIYIYLQIYIHTGDWQLHRDNVPNSYTMSQAKFSGKTSNHPGDSVPLQPRFGFKITFEREEVSNNQWDSGKYDRAADSNWENCVRSPGAYFEGDWGIIVLCTMFLVSCIFFNTCLYFSYYMAGYFLERPHIPLCTYF